MPAHSFMFRVIKIFTHIETSRHIQSYSGIFSTLCNSRVCTTLSCHILSPNIFKTGGLLQTLWNVDQAYLELCHGALCSHILAYQNLMQHLHMQKPGILGILEYSEPFHNCIPKHIQNPVISTKIFEYSELTYLEPNTYLEPSQRFKMEFFARIVKNCH